MNTKNKKRFLLTTSSFAALFLILLGTCIFFKNVLFNGNLIGNRVDGRLNTFFTEHWYQVFCGNETWTDLRCFYPTSNVLSYSDIMLGFSFPYSLFRLVGLDMYMAFKYSVIFIHTLGSISLWYFMNKCLKCSQWIALIAVAGFSFSNGYYAIMTNPQMIAESLLPLILICLFYYMTYFDNKKRFFFALSGIGIFLLLFYTAYYVAYFTCVLLLIFFLCFALIAFLCIPFKNILSSLKKVLAHWPEYLGYLVLCILSMIPFLYLYLPSYNRLGGRSWKDVLMYAPTLPNLIGREIDNFLGFDPTVYHLKMGFPAVFLGLFFFFATWFAVLFLTTRHKDKRCSIQDVLRKSLTVCCIISLFLMIVWGNGICLWYPFFKFLPGASAIRGISRWLAFITLPLSVCFSLLVDKCLKNRQWLRWILLPCLAMFTFLCNHSDVGVSTDWNRASEISFLASVPAPPKDCEIMYLTDKTHTSNDPARTWELQMDAWAIAQFYGLKTVNGYSGQLPNNWDLLIGHDDIDTKVIHWLEGTSVTDAILYSYDIGTHKWSKITFP